MIFIVHIDKYCNNNGIEYVGNAHTIYILGNPVLDLVPSPDGINVDNRPNESNKISCT